jgi:quercetin dioxygenase-like cupin family protein
MMTLADSGKPIPLDLIMQLQGQLRPGEKFVRIPHFDEVITNFPRDIEVRTVVYQSELAPSVAVPWHVHNGLIFALILQGEIHLQFAPTGAASAEEGDPQSKLYRYGAGSVFVEPVGALHRAYNPNPDVPMVSLAFQVTPADRDHIVNFVEVPEDLRLTTAPDGPPMPSAQPVGRLANSRPGS